MSGTFYAVAPLPDTNARQVAQTIRVPSTALLTIDSEDRNKDFYEARAFPARSTPYNFAISKNESLMPGFMTRIGVSEVVFPWTIPNINLKTCRMNYSYVIAAAPPVVGTITLGLGFYTPVQLAAAITAQFAGVVGLGFLMSWSAPTGLPFFQYGVSVGNTFSFQPMDYNSGPVAGPPAIPAYPYPATTKQLFDLVGFNDGATTLANQYFGGFTNCQAIRYVDIVCNQLTNSQAQKDQTSQTVARDMLCRIYVGGAPGVQSVVSAYAATPLDPINTYSPPGCAPTTIYRNFTEAKQIQWIPNQNIPGFLRFNVYDDTGAPLDECVPYLFTTDWSMTLLVSEV
jgi:hypothetical protein